MKIIKHGTALRFRCGGCKCEFVACQDECQRKPKYRELMPTGSYEYWYNCPECGRKTQGQEIIAEDVSDGREAEGSDS